MNRHGELIKLQGHISFPFFLDLSPFMEAKTSFAQLKSSKYRHNSLKVQERIFVPSMGRLLEQQNSQIIPHLHSKLGDNSLFSSPSKELFKAPFEEFLERKSANIFVGNCSKEKVADLRNDCNNQQRDSSKKMEISSRRSSTSCMYRLCSVVEHYGRPGSGHYAVYRKVASPQLTSDDTGKPTNVINGSWVYISDGDVRRVGKEDVLSAEASILFYEKVEGDR